MPDLIPDLITIALVGLGFVGIVVALTGLVLYGEDF